MRMKWMIAAVGILGFLVVLVLYCCIRAGAQEDRMLEALEQKGRQDARGENG